MSGALVTEVLYRAGVLLGDIAPQFDGWSQRELLAWLNDGQRAIAKYVPIAGSRIDAIKLVAGSLQSIRHISASMIVPGDGSTPTDVEGLSLNDIISNMGTDGQTPGEAITPVSRDFLENFDRRWRAITPRVGVVHFTFDPRMPQFFYVYPPSDGTGWVEASFMALPDDVPAPAAEADYGKDGTSSATTGIDQRWSDDLVNYVVARAWMKDSQDAANAQAAQQYIALFVNAINSQVQVLTGQNPNLKYLPFAAEAPAAAS